MSQPSFAHDPVTADDPAPNEVVDDPGHDDPVDAHANEVDADAADRAELAATLGLPAEFSEAELRNTYRRLARTHHPDHGGDADFMMTINEAYERLLQLPVAASLDDFLGEPEDGWTWADEPAADAVGAFDRARTLVSFVLLPLAALALLTLAVWFITRIS